MYDVLDGVRIIELASFVYVPSACSLLGEWGADVIKVEEPVRGDPLRGLEEDAQATTKAPVRFLFELANRNKRGIVLDLRSAEGREALYELLRQADIFVTNLRQPSLVRLGLDYDRVRTICPSIVYARGTGQGGRGDEADKPAFDGTSFWARSGFINSLTPPSSSDLSQGPRGSGDLISGMALALGILGGFLKRQRTGESVLVESSLLGAALWAMAFETSVAANTGEPTTRRVAREEAPNPLSISYRTRDARYVKLSMHQADKYWTSLCKRLGVEEIAELPQFRTAQNRFDNRAACVAALDEAFARHTLAEWQDKLAGFEGPWETVQSALEVSDDPQVRANRFVQRAITRDGAELSLVSGPVQFDRQTSTLLAAPGLGEHTVEVVNEFGLGSGTSDRSK